MWAAWMVIFILGAFVFAIGWSFGGPTAGAIALVIYGATMVCFQLGKQEPL